jgi:putative hemolysin
VNFGIQSVNTKRENNVTEILRQSELGDTRLSQRSTVRTVTSEPVLVATSLYSVSLARTADDLIECQRLRYFVFNLELHQGLSTSDRNGLDVDPFDSFCDHLMVRDLESGRLVGTYRLQTGEIAARYLGYYGETFFDFSAYQSIRKEVLELGRACVHEDFRNMMVLHSLWKGIAIYATRVRARYLLGCNSISSQDENYGMAMYESLKEKHLVEQALRTMPQPGCGCRSTGEVVSISRPPRLFRAYLDISAKVCGPPAIDRDFKTIDFLTLVDLVKLPDRFRTRFF